MLRYLLLIILLIGTTHLSAQNTQIRGFVDIGMLYQNDTLDFNIGQLDNYITSEITDRISFLSETTFTFKGDEDKVVVELERVIIKYEVDNYLNFHIGKHHTPIGYWNTAYHHGTVLQPTIRRPLVFSFTEVYPIHTTGLLISGDFIGEKKFGYSLMIGNGIGSNIIADNDNFKSITLSAHFKPIEGLLIGASGYIDRIASGVTNKKGSIVTSSITQNLFTATLIYLDNDKPFEFMTEYIAVRNKDSTENIFNSKSGYIYTGYRIKDFTPYYRLDFMNFDKDDPYFQTDKLYSHIFGLRYSFNYLANIKLEYNYLDSEQSGTNNLIMLQFGIGF